MIRRAAPSLLLLSCALLASAGEEPQPPADPAARERIEAWGRDLASSEYARREEAAKRLLEAGSDAVWLLREIAAGTDAEASARAQEMLERIAWAPPSVRKGIEEQIAILKGTRDPKAWGEAHDRLRDGLGEPARKALRDLFPDIRPDPKDFEMTVRAKERALAPGAEIPFSVRIRSLGKDPVWIRTSWFRATVGRDRIVEALPFDHRKRGEMDPRSVLSLNPPKGTMDLVYLEPGGTFELDLQVDGSRAEFAGRARLAVSYISLGRPRQVRDLPVGVPDARIARRADYSRIFAWATELSLSAETGPVYLLPRLADAPAVGASLSIEAKAPAEAEAGKPISVEVEIVGQGDTPTPVAAPAEGGAPAQGFWALLLDKEGRPVDLASFADSPYVERTVALKKGTRLGLKGLFRPEAPPGDYRLAVGYTAACPRADGAPADRPPTMPQLWSGTVVSESVPLRIR